MKTAPWPRKSHRARHPRRPARKTRFPRSAFTLVELLIVIAIIAIMVPAIIEIQSRMQVVGQHRAAKLASRTASTELLRHWRRDVTKSHDAKIVAEGQAMEIALTDEDGAQLSVRYELEPAEGRIVRRVITQESPESDRLMTRNAKNLRFEPVGRGFRMRWVNEHDDGIHTLKWTRGGIAAPLLPAVSSKERTTP